MWSKEDLNTYFLSVAFEFSVFRFRSIWGGEVIVFCLFLYCVHFYCVLCVWLLCIVCIMLCVLLLCIVLCVSWSSECVSLLLCWNRSIWGIEPQRSPSPQFTLIERDQNAIVSHWMSYCFSPKSNFYLNQTMPRMLHTLEVFLQLLFIEVNTQDGKRSI